MKELKNMFEYGKDKVVNGVEHLLSFRFVWTKANKNIAKDVYYVCDNGNTKNLKS